MRFVLVALGVLFVMGFVPSQSSAASAHEPRAFGYFVGDLVERSLEIVLAEGEEIVPASLPAAAQLTYWLDLRKVTVSRDKQGGREIETVRLGYQIFYVPVSAKKMTIPGVTIDVKGPAGTRKVSLPPLPVLISPIREIYPEKSGETTDTFLKPDAQAGYLSTSRFRNGALASGAAAALALGFLAFHSGWWPFHARPGRPFTEAARNIASSGTTYAAALVALHRAFDRTFGKRLMSVDLDAFFRTSPAQEGLKEDVSRFFRVSQMYFYQADTSMAEDALPREDLSDLARKLAANERAYA